MAEYFGRQWFEDNGFGNYKVISRGLTDQYEPPGSPASENGLIVLKEDFNIDMSQHRSSLLNQTEVDEAEAIICVSSGHKAFIHQNFANCEKKVHTFSSGIADPWHAPMEVYRACAHQISELVPAQLTSMFKNC